MNGNRIGSLVVLALLLSPALAGCQLHGKPHVRRTSAIRASMAGIGAGPQGSAPAGTAAVPAASADVIAPGIVEPWGAQVDLSAQEPGWISAILVREGEVVRAGQPLGRLEDEAQRRALDLARADLAEAIASLDKVRHGATPEELRQARADFDAAVARRDFAQSAAQRNSRLREVGAIPEVDKERTLSEATAQTALARRAQARLDELMRGARAEDRSAATARVSAARARVEVAEADLARRQVVAPSAGTILLSRFHVGEFYTPDAGPLFALGDLTRLQVRLEVDEIDALDVRVGAPCTLYSDGDAPLARGTLVRLAPRMGRRALPLESPTARVDVRVREVFVEVPANARLIPGQRVWGHSPRMNRR